MATTVRRAAITIGVIAMTLGLGWLAGTAQAAKNAKPTGNAKTSPATQAGAGRKQQRRGHYSFGTITAIDGKLITIKPERPDFMPEKTSRTGSKPKTLPASLSFTVNAETSYQRNGKTARLADYKVGDEIAAVLSGKVSKGQGIALKLLDIDTVRQTYGKLAARFANRPVYGRVVALDRGSLTLQPEVPEFVAQQRQERAAKRALKTGSGGAVADGKATPSAGKNGKAQRERKQPAAVVVKLATATQFWQSNAQLQSDPFHVGDKVAVFPAQGTTRAALTAGSVTDYATAQARLSQRHKRSAGAKAGKHKGGKGKAKQAKAAT